VILSKVQRTKFCQGRLFFTFLCTELLQCLLFYYTYSYITFLYVYITHLVNVRLTFPIYFPFMYSLNLISSALFFCLSKPREFLQFNFYIPSSCRIIILWLSVFSGTTFCWLFYLHLLLCSPYTLFCMFIAWRILFLTDLFYALGKKSVQHYHKARNTF